MTMGFGGGRQATVPGAEEEATFIATARRLAGLAGAVLGWPPDTFWRSTPDELRAVLGAMAPARPTIAGSADIAKLMEIFPDG